MLNIALTFDYELFFGENFGSSDKILFEPTDKLLDCLDKHNVKATFFADVLSVYMHNKYGLHDYCEKFISQIKDMVSRGHDVQLHIHSNWLKSVYEDGKWIFDIDSYRIHSFGFDLTDEMSAPNIIKWGKNFLEDTLRMINQDYKCIAYRAGGYSVQPHKQLFEVFLQNGIFIDSSVAIGQKAKGVNQYDFSNCPQKCGWWIDKNGKLETISTVSDDSVYEVPVYFYKNSLFRKLFDPKSEQRLKLTEKRGTFIGTQTVMAVPKKKSKFKLLFEYGKIKSLLSVDSLPHQAILRAVNVCTQKVKEGKGSIAIIGHPKLIDSVWLNNFDKTVQGLVNKTEIKLTTMQEIGLRLEMEKLNEK